MFGLLQLDIEFEVKLADLQQYVVPSKVSHARKLFCEAPGKKTGEPLQVKRAERVVSVLSKCTQRYVVSC